MVFDGKTSISHRIFVIRKCTLWNRNEEGTNFLFNDALNTFYLRLYDIGDMVKDHSDSKR